MKRTLIIISLLVATLGFSGCKSGPSRSAPRRHAETRNRFDLPIRVQVDYVYQIDEVQSVRAALISR